MHWISLYLPTSIRYNTLLKLETKNSQNTNFKVTFFDIGRNCSSDGRIDAGSLPIFYCRHVTSNKYVCYMREEFQAASCGLYMYVCHLKVLLVANIIQRGWWINMEHGWKLLNNENLRPRRNPCFIATLSIATTISTGLGSNPNVRGEIPATTDWDMVRVVCLFHFPVSVCCLTTCVLHLLILYRCV